MWIARNRFGGLALYREKPVRVTEDRCIPSRWGPTNDKNYDFLDTNCWLNGNMFPNLTWKDEPIEVDIVRKEFKYCAKDTALRFYLTKELYNNENYLNVIKNHIMHENIIIIFEYELDGNTNIGTAYVNSLVVLENVFKQLEKIFYVDSKE